MRNPPPTHFCKRCQSHHKKLFHFKRKWKSKFSRGEIITCIHHYEPKTYAVPKQNSLYEVIGTCEYSDVASNFVVVQSLDEENKLTYTMWDENHFQFYAFNKFHLKFANWLMQGVESFMYYICKINKLK